MTVFGGRSKTKYITCVSLNGTTVGDLKGCADASPTADPWAVPLHAGAPETFGDGGLALWGRSVFNPLAPAAHGPGWL